MADEETVVPPDTTLEAMLKAFGGGDSSSSFDFSSLGPAFGKGYHPFDGQYTTEVGPDGKPTPNYQFNLNPGPTSANVLERYKQVVNPITDAANKFAIGPIEGVNSNAEAMMAISYWESGRWQANIVNSSYGASGLFQFIPSTAQATLNSMNAKGLLNGVTDPIATQAHMGAYFTQQNAEFLKSHGHKLTLGNLYLAHWFGTGGANSILTASDNQTLLSVLPALGTGGLAANGFQSNVTIGEVKAKADQLMKLSLEMTRKYEAEATGKAPAPKAEKDAPKQGNTITGEVDKLVGKGRALLKSLVNENKEHAGDTAPASDKTSDLTPPKNGGPRSNLTALKHDDKTPAPTAATPGTRTAARPTSGSTVEI